MKAAIDATSFGYRHIPICNRVFASHLGHSYVRVAGHREHQGNQRHLAAEIATKSAIGKLAIRLDDLKTALDDLQLRILPCTAEHAIRLVDLPLHHRDPFDRQIIAQAIAENIPVVTCDPQFRLYKGLRVIW